jgi:hypothetical protein
MRVVFVQHGTNVTNLSRPQARRAFTTATVLYFPPIRLDDYLHDSGLIDQEGKDLVVMRCRPPQKDAVDATLATWPNVLLAIQHDVPQSSDACDSKTSSLDQQASCFAKGFGDPPSASASSALANAFTYVGGLYDGNHTALTKWLSDNYGIYPAFSGIGYTVRDSYSIDRQPMTAQQVLVKSVSSEYVLKNVTLAEAGCHCVSITSTERHPDDLLDPDFIERAGGDGTCTQVHQLGVTPR